MAYYDLFAQYRDPDLTASERESLDQAALETAEMTGKMEAAGARRVPGGYELDGQFSPLPTVGAHIDIAMRRAEAQFSAVEGPNPRGNTVMPEDVDVALRFPGIDPVGKYSRIDMKFAQREAALNAALSCRPPEVRQFVAGLRQAQRTNERMVQITFSMRQAARKQRTLLRASKLCLDQDGRDLLHVQARTMDADLPAAQYDAMLQGMEYAAGLKPGPLPADIAAFYRDQLHLEIPGSVLEAAQVYERPAALDVPFQDLEHKALQEQFANPHYWGKSRAQLQEDLQTVDLYDRLLPPYASATVERALGPALAGAERFGSSRADLIIVDGMTVREKMAAEGIENPTARQIKEHTDTYVAAALMAGEAVEAYLPDKNGRLPQEPVRLTRSGYAPDPMKPVVLNAWERFWNKHGGFYRDKADKAAAYDRLMAARQKVTATHAATMEAYDLALARRNGAALGAIGQDAMKSLFFGADRAALAAVNSSHMFPTSRSAPTTACICAMAAAGHPIADIIDPTKLQAEKLAMGQEYLRRAAAMDAKWLGETYFAGQKKLLEYLDAYDKKHDMTDARAVARNLPVLAAVGYTVVDVNQEKDREGVRQAAILLAETQHPGRALEAVNDQMDRCNTYGAYLGYAQTTAALQHGLREGTLSAPDMNRLGPKLGSVFCEEQSRRLLRDARAAQPGKTLGELASGQQLLTMLGSAMVCAPATQMGEALRNGSPEMRRAAGEQLATGKIQQSMEASYTTRTVESTVKGTIVTRNEAGQIVSAQRGDVKHRETHTELQVAAVTFHADNKPISFRDNALQTDARKKDPGRSK